MKGQGGFPFNGYKFPPLPSILSLSLTMIILWGCLVTQAVWGKKAVWKDFSCFDRIKQLKKCLVNTCFKELFCPK